MLVKTTKSINIQVGMVGTESKSVIVKIGAIQSNDMLQSAKLSMSVADANSQVRTQQGARPNVLGQAVIDLNRDDLNLSSNRDEFKELVFGKIAAYFSALNPDLTASDFEEVIV